MTDKILTGDEHNIFSAPEAMLLMSTLFYRLREIGINNEDSPVYQAALKVMLEIDRLIKRNDGLIEDKNQAYSERNHLVAHLARLYPSGIRPTEIDGWDSEWNGCVYIDLPKGQVSYHYHDSEIPMFHTLPAYQKPYDGHDKATVHARLQNYMTGQEEPSYPVELIVAVINDWERNDIMGVNDALPWGHLPHDMKRFKQITMDAGAVYMGAVTARSIGKYLPGRLNIVLTHGEEAPFEGQIAVKSIEEAIEIAKKVGAPKLMVIGGNSVYTQAVSYLTGFHLTSVYNATLELDLELDKTVRFKHYDDLWHLSDLMFATNPHGGAEVIKRETMKDGAYLTRYTHQAWKYSARDMNLMS